MKRIFLFLLTNIAIMLVISIVISVFGLGQILDQNGVHIDLMSLLMLSAVVGYDRLIYFPCHVQIDGQALRGRLCYSGATERPRAMAAQHGRASSYCGRYRDARSRYL